MKINHTNYQVVTSILLCLFMILPTSTAYAVAVDKTANVDIGLVVNDISSINERNETVSFEGTLTLQWHEPDLQNSAKKMRFYVNDTADAVIKNMWFPYFIFIHGRGAKNVVAKSLAINPSGEVTYRERFYMTVETRIDMRQFPFDSQIITLSVEPFIQNFTKMTLTVDKQYQSVVERSDLEEWRIVGVQSSIEKNNSAAPIYTLKIKHERKSEFYVSRVVIPLILLVVLSWCIFWLEKQPTINSIAILLTALLTIVAFQWVVINTTPRVSYHTFFQSLLLFSYIIVGSSIAMLTLIDNVNSNWRRKLIVFSRIVYPLSFILGILILIYMYFG